MDDATIIFINILWEINYQKPHHLSDPTGYNIPTSPNTMYCGGEPELTVY